MRSTSDTWYNWFADDATDAGSLSFSLVLPFFCWTWFWVFPNSSKTVLIVKPENFDDAESIFADANIWVTDQGQQHINWYCIGIPHFCWRIIMLFKKRQTGIAEVSALADAAATWPRAAFTNGMADCLM